MTVDAQDPACVLDSHAAPQLTAPPRLLDSPVRDCSDRCAVTCNQVNTKVRPVLMKNRMVPHFRKTGRDVLEIERESQRLRPQRLAVGVVEMHLAALIAERKRTQGAAAVTDLRRLQSGNHARAAVAAD